MSGDTTFRAVLIEHKLSTTKPRLAVYEALQHHKSLTMGELVATCDGVDRASVYRVVDVFERLGIVVRIPNGWKYLLELGEAFNEHHHHATCNQCGGSISLPEDSELEKRLREMASRRKFSMTAHQIELIGTCEACQLAEEN